MNVKFDHTKDQINEAMGVSDISGSLSKAFNKLTDSEKVVLAGIGYNVLRAEEEKMLSLLYTIERDISTPACLKIGETIANETKVSKILEIIAKEYPNLIDKLAFIGRVELLSKILVKEEV